MTQKVTIAIIAGQLVVGGAERQLYLWLSNLDRQKFQPIVLTLHPGYDDYWEKPIKSLEIPLFQIPRRQIRIVRLLDVVRVLHPYKPKLIHGWHMFASSYAGAAGMLLGAKSLGSLRSAFRSLSDTPLASTLMLYLVNSILANSRSAAEQLHTIRKRKKQTIYTVQNAVEDQELNNRSALRERLGQQFGVSPASIWIGSLGRLDPGKRFDLLLQVISLLLEDMKDFHFLLIGDGPERLRLENIAQTLGISEYVIFAGEVPGASAWLSALDIFCFTSLDEGLPNAVMEAAMAGVPIVSWRVPFMEELLNDGRAALLIEPENLIAFKETLLNLIHSQELRVKIGKEGRSHMLKNFSIDRFIKRMTSVYNDLLGIQPICKNEEL